MSLSTMLNLSEQILWYEFFCCTWISNGAGEFVTYNILTYYVVERTNIRIMARVVTLMWFVPSHRVKSHVKADLNPLSL